MRSRTSGRILSCPGKSCFSWSWPAQNKTLNQCVVCADFRETSPLYRQKQSDRNIECIQGWKSEYLCLWTYPLRSPNHLCPFSNPENLRATPEVKQRIFYWDSRQMPASGCFTGQLMLFQIKIKFRQFCAPVTRTELSWGSLFSHLGFCQILSQGWRYREALKYFQNTRCKIGQNQPITFFSPL